MVFQMCLQILLPLIAIPFIIFHLNLNQRLMSKLTGSFTSNANQSDENSTGIENIFHAPITKYLEETLFGENRSFAQGFNIHNFLDYILQNGNKDNVTQESDKTEDSLELRSHNHSHKTHEEKNNTEQTSVVENNLFDAFKLKDVGRPIIKSLVEKKKFNLLDVSKLQEPNVLKLCHVIKMVWGKDKPSDLEFNKLCELKIRNEQKSKMSNFLDSTQDLPQSFVQTVNVVQPPVNRYGIFQPPYPNANMRIDTIPQLVDLSASPRLTFNRYGNLQPPKNYMKIPTRDLKNLDLASQPFNEPFNGFQSRPNQIGSFDDKQSKIDQINFSQRRINPNKEDPNFNNNNNNIQIGQKVYVNNNDLKPLYNPNQFQASNGDGRLADIRVYGYPDLPSNVHTSRRYLPT